MKEVKEANVKDLLEKVEQLEAQHKARSQDERLSTVEQQIDSLTSAVDALLSCVQSLNSRINGPRQN